MNSIRAVQTTPPPNIFSALGASTAAPKPATTSFAVKDSDGDFDGTKFGQSDARDFGKGVNLDRRA